MSKLARFLLVGNMVLLTAVVALGGYHVFFRQDGNAQALPQSVAMMLASFETKLERYRAESLTNPAPAGVTEDQLRTAIRSSVYEALEDGQQRIQGLADARKAASTLSVELGDKAQELLDFVTNRSSANMVAAASIPGTDGGLTIEQILNLPPTAAGRIQPATALLEELPLIKGETRRLREVHFSPGSAELSPGARNKTLEAIEQLKKLDAGKVRVIGFTDTTGAEGENLDLSRQRAAAVAKMLSENGIPASRIKVIAKGEAPGPYPTSDGVDEPLNRCVGIIAMK